MQKIIIYCDGGSRGNPGPAACAFVVKNSAGKILYQEGKFLGKKTNNEAEYHGVILALEWLKKGGQHFFSQLFPSITERQTSSLSSQERTADFFLDSKLVVNQLKGFFKIKNSKLRELFFQIKILEKEIGEKINYHLIPRRENKNPDNLLNKILDKYST